MFRAASCETVRVSLREFFFSLIVLLFLKVLNKGDFPLFRLQRYKKIIPFARAHRRHTPSGYLGFNFPIPWKTCAGYRERVYEVFGMGFPDIRKTFGNNVNGV